MKFLVLSDTHIPRRAKCLPLRVMKELDRVDGVIHTGDFTSIELVKILEQHSFFGVSGNMDEEEVKEVLPRKRVIEINGLKIGLIHGYGHPFGLGSRIIGEFRDIELNCIIYGHSHNPTLNKKNGVLLFNPGSPTGRFLSGSTTFGILNIEKGSLRATHIKVE